MAIQGLPPGLAKKAEKSGAEGLPGNNPHVQAYKAQQEVEALKAEKEQLQGQVTKLQEEQKTVGDVLGFINALLAAALEKKQQEKPAETGNTGAATQPAPAVAAEKVAA